MFVRAILLICDDSVVWPRFSKNSLLFFVHVRFNTKKTICLFEDAIRSVHNKILAFVEICMPQSLASIRSSIEKLMRK